MHQSDALTRILDEKVEFLLLQFTDIMGSIKNGGDPGQQV